MPLVKLYELDNVKGQSTSPFVWRAKFALQRKRVPYESVTVGFFGLKDVGTRLRDSLEPATVPMIEFGDEFIVGSWAIAEWLDRTFNTHPALFSSPAEWALARFFDKWFGAAVLQPMFRSCVYEIFQNVRPEEQDYFRTTREKTIGQKLEEVAREAGQYLARARAGLEPMRLALRNLPFLGGEEPSYADHIAWSAFVGFSFIAKQPFLHSHDDLHPWLERGIALSACCTTAQAQINQKNSL